MLIRDVLVGNEPNGDRHTMILERLAAALADRYTLDRELGAGGMATVYLARDLKHERDVAIKVLRPELAAVIGADRFLSEIRTTANLQHPHILPLFDSGATRLSHPEQSEGSQQFLYYVMPFVEGESLRDRLDREKQLPIADALRIASEVASALDYAHRRGIIHRDIKPENILLHDGQALVADFGIALAATSAGSRMTETGMSLGTPHYMSPEQAMGERSLDARSDIYALGAMTYEMLVGDPPFTGSTAQAIVAKVMTEKPAAPSRMRDTIPASVEDAVLTALQKLPADRFASAAEFSAALKGGDGTTSRQTVAYRTAAPAGPARFIWPALAAVAVAAAAWGWLRPTSGDFASATLRYAVSLDSIAVGRDAVGQLAVSPDGELLAYAYGPDDRLMLRRRDAVEFSSLADTEDARSPFFSPDGESLGFLRGSQVIVVPLGGGPLTVYTDSLAGAQTPAWGDDGYIYGIYRGEPGGLMRMRAEPGAPIESFTTLDRPAGEIWHLFPDPLPGGRGVLFTMQHPQRGYHIAVAAPDGTHTILLEGARARYASTGHLLYTTMDGTLWSVPFDPGTLQVTGDPSRVATQLKPSVVGPIEFAISRNGTLAYTASDARTSRELVWVNRDGGVTPVDSTWRGDFVTPALSPNDDRIVVTLREGDVADLWVRSTSAGQPSRLTFGQGKNAGAVWHPNGQSVVYLSGENRPEDVWMKPVDGTAAPTRLTTSDRAISEVIMSPTGQSVLVRTTTSTAGSGDILEFTLGDSVVVPIISSPALEYSPTLSPDGAWMAYASDDNGRLEIYVVPFPIRSGVRWRVSTNGGSMPLWSRNGREIYYVDRMSRLVATTVTTGGSVQVGATIELFSVLPYVVDVISRRNYDADASGNRFLMIRAVGGQSGEQVIVTENWQGPTSE